MKWLLAEDTPRLIVVSSSDLVIGALQRVDTRFSGLLIEPADGLLDVIDALGKRSAAIHAVFVDSALRCAGTPAASSALWLCRQIRLASSWTRLQRTWLVVSDRIHPSVRLRTDAEWVFMYSQGCSLVPVWGILAELGRIDAEPRLPLNDDAAVRGAMASHAFLGDLTRAVKSHDVRNDRGWVRLASELGISVTQSSASVGEPTDVIDQALAIESFLGPTPSATADVSIDDLRTWVQGAVRNNGLKFGLFDDQQDLGWRPVIHAMLFGGDPASGGTHQLRSVRSAAEALAFFETAKGVMQERLRTWASAIADERNQLAAVRRANKSLQQAQREVASAKQSREGESADTSAEAAFGAAKDKEQQWISKLAKAKKGSQDSQQRSRSLGGVLEADMLDVVFLDLRLDTNTDRYGAPHECSGSKVLAELRRTHPFLPVIMLTASARAETVMKVRELGADGYWIKDVSSARDLLVQAELACRKAAVHRAWLKLQRVVSLNDACRFKWDSHANKPQKVPWPKDTNRAIVQSLLENVCAVLAECTELPVVGRTPAAVRCSQVVRDLGLAQELRLTKATLDNRSWYRNMPLLEGQLREARNRATHNGATPAVPEVLSYLDYTLTSLLQNPLE